jgi:2-polyprenyl-3-methyl-5-hydroxy-6-metoxy-1,4-benzoquinol methylase
MKEELSNTDKAQIFQEQEVQYEYPYHHIPHFLEDKSATRTRNLDWGFDYLACQYFTKLCIEKINPSSVLEVGCGDGAIIGSLSPDIPRRVGVDLSERAISFAQVFFPGVEFKAQDAGLISEQFDAVLAVEVLEHIPDEGVSSFLRILEDKTCSNGYIYISVPSVNLPLYKKHFRHYTPNLLQKQIEEAGLNVDILEMRFFRSPVLFENFYKRLTCNRFWIGEFHPLRRIIWKNIVSSIETYNSKTAQHVIAVLKKK